MTYAGWREPGTNIFLQTDQGGPVLIALSETQLGIVIGFACVLAFDVIAVAWFWLSDRR